MNTIDWSKAPAEATHLIKCTDPDFEREYWCIESGDRYKHINSEAFLKKNSVGVAGWLVFSRPPQWTGDGMPPVGTMCEVMCGALPSTAFDWELCTVLLINEGSDGKPQVCTRDFRGDIAIYYPDVDSVYFRPVRTAEQTAAEERDSQIICLADELAGYQDRETGDKHKKLAEYLHDNGYRKQAAE